MEELQKLQNRLNPEKKIVRVKGFYGVGYYTIDIDEEGKECGSLIFLGKSKEGVKWLLKSLLACQ